MKTLDSIERLRECVVEGHKWGFEVLSFDGECTLIYFKCQRCKAKTSKWLHDKEHETFTGIVLRALNEMVKNRGN